MDICPNIKKHTKRPNGYIDWHRWAEKKSKTHRPVLCLGCDKYTIWVKKTKKDRP